MSYSIIIPARYESSRLPGKPLLDIGGKSMIQRVYERAITSSAQEVVVATDDQRIADAVNGFGGQVEMTSSTHQSGTDRIQEVVAKRGYSNDHVVVNLQGDEPLLAVKAIEQVANNVLQDSIIGIGTLCELITDIDELLDPNAVKVVKTNNDIALYFSRRAIPYVSDAALSVEQRDVELNTLPYQWYRHIGIYAYRVEVLNQFVKWPVAMLEKSESLEQLRALANNVVIHCAKSQVAIPGGVDTPEDLEKVRQYVANIENR